MKKLSTQKFKVILFDLGNTLIYFYDDWQEVEPACVSALESSLIGSGYSLMNDFKFRFLDFMKNSFTEFEHSLADYSMEQMLRGFMNESGIVEFSNGSIRKAVNSFFSISQQHWLPRADTLEALEELRADGYRMGIISNASDEPDVRELMEKANVSQFMELLLVSCSVGLRKPHPGIFQLALDHFGIQADEAVMVGDTLSADIAGANQSNITSIWITHRAERPDNHKYQDSIKPTASIQFLNELPGLLRNWPA